MRSKNTTLSDDFGAGTVHTMHLYYFLVVVFLQMSNVESSDFPFLKNFFTQNRAFLSRGEDVVKNGCSEEREHTLTFSKHQKLLKSRNYS